MSECNLQTCKHITDMEECYRVLNERLIQAERDMFSALDHDAAVTTLRKTLHATDDKVQELQRDLEVSYNYLKEILPWFAPYFERARAWRKHVEHLENTYGYSRACSP